MKALIFGETAIDLVVHDSAQVFPDNRVRGDKYSLSVGGYGANQALALSKLEVETYLVSSLGLDIFGNIAIGVLDNTSINMMGVVQKPGNTAVGILALNNARVRVLAFAEGINKDIGNEEMQRFKALCTKVDVCLFSFGYPVSAVSDVLIYAKTKGITTILDPVHAGKDMPRELYRFVDIIAPSNYELEDLIGRKVANREDALDAANIIHDLGTPIVIIKFGEQGVFYSDRGFHHFIPSHKVEAVNPIGAGDVFLAGVAAGIIRNLNLDKCIRWGNAAAAIRVANYNIVEAPISIASIERYVEGN